jgi:predicted TIM-barrel fold metal-dependent hydrolase
LIDCAVHHTWSSADELVDYLSAGWREYVAANVAPEWSEFLRGTQARPDTPMRYSPMTPTSAYLRPGNDKLTDASPGPGRLPGSDLDTLRRDHLDAHDIDRALLCPSFGMLVPSVRQTHLATEISRAANDWTIDRWLDDADPRLYGVAVAPSQLPDAAAAEIRRIGSHPRMVAVVMATSPLGKPLGHPVYDPIYRAASEAGLVVLVHAGGSGMAENLITSGPSAGPPATYADYNALLPQVQMAHVTSLISQGTFERHPDLRMQMVGSGAAWVVPFLWRFDTNYQGMRIEAPTLSSRPSEIFRSNFRVTAYPLDPAPSPEQLAGYYGAMRGIEDILCYGSGYPNWDAVSPSELRAVLPPAWQDKIMHENALHFFDWNAATEATPRAALQQD